VSRSEPAYASTTIDKAGILGSQFPQSPISFPTRQRVPTANAPR
jgi:hypothetical protein